MDFIEELTWRGMVHDIMPGTKEQLNKEMTTAYVGFDPTADSLHIGHMVGVMILRHLQRAGHRPIVLLGGATGMIGDPSGKSSERNMLSEADLRHNQQAIKEQLAALIDFDTKSPNAALLVNNYDWMSKQSFLGFIRDIGKHITVNYMIAKDSVKRRFSGEGEGMSFTEFTYQLVQGYDYLYLYENYGCRLQMGGSDQWGNITTGTELIRRKVQGEAFAMTCPLIKKADGTKFGKTESGNVWLSPRYTSPYKFYQFWLGTSDEDAQRYIKIFTFLTQDEIATLIAEHLAEPHLRKLQRKLAEEITVAIHGREQYERAVAASGILFGASAVEALRMIDKDTFLQVFEGVPQFDVQPDVAAILRGGESVPLSTLVVEAAPVFASKGELRRLVQGGGISLCGVKVADAEMAVDRSMLISDEYLLIQKGKKNYFLVHVNR